MPVERNLTFLPGVTFLTVAIQTVQDEVAEGDEILRGVITSLNPLVVLGSERTDIIIFDDDGNDIQMYI